MTVVLSGLLISQYVARVVGLTIVPTSLWVSAHRWSADATIASLLVHFALHWRWMEKTTGQLGRLRRDPADDSILAMHAASRRLERSPRGERYATAPVTTDARYRP